MRAEGKKMYHDISPGYQGLLVAGVTKNGDCIDCQTIVNKDRYSEDFCYFDKLAKRVASKAFSKSPNCKYPKGVDFKLRNTCLDSSFSAGVLSAIFDYEAKYCGKKKNIIVALEYQKYAPTKKEGMQWFVATK
jgi:hypothetical protein